tara:strand:- start:361 stop:627 length:267 start_codon:yes stop_codon:yes gene_type:complete
MLKELKYIFYVIFIFFFIFLIIRFYFSDDNKKKSYRSYHEINDKIKTYTSDLPVLINDTENIIYYVENVQNQNKKKYHFWKLLKKDEK